MEENRTWEADNYWIELLKKYNRSKLEELRKEKAGKNGAIVLGSYGYKHSRQTL